MSWTDQSCGNIGIHTFTQTFANDGGNMQACNAYAVSNPFVYNGNSYTVNNTSCSVSGFNSVKKVTVSDDSCIPSWNASSWTDNGCTTTFPLHQYTRAYTIPSGLSQSQWTSYLYGQVGNTLNGFTIGNYSMSGGVYTANVNDTTGCAYANNQFIWSQGQTVTCSTSGQSIHSFSCNNIPANATPSQALQFCQNNPGRSPGYLLLNGISFGGTNITSFTGNVNQCGAACNTTANCVGTVLNTTNAASNTCYLKSWVNNPSNVANHITMFQFGQSYSGFDSGGNDISNFTCPDIPTCRNSCYTTGNCLMSVYDSSTNTCYLKNAISAISVSANRNLVF